MRSASERAADEHRQASRAVRVLHVEDRDEDAAFVASMIKAPAFALDRIETLAEALECLRTERYDAILLDLNLPDSDGLATVRAITQATEAPVVVVTVVGDITSARGALRLGAQDYVVKGRFDEAGLKRSLDYALIRAEISDREADPRRSAGAALSARGVPLAERDPASFARLTRSFLDWAKGPGPSEWQREQARGLARALAAAAAGARDVMDLYLEAVEQGADGHPITASERAQARLHALETMGYLAEEYRIRAEAGGERPE